MILESSWLYKRDVCIILQTRFQREAGSTRETSALQTIFQRVAGSTRETSALQTKFWRVAGSTREMSALETRFWRLASSTRETSELYSRQDSGEQLALQESHLHCRQESGEQPALQERHLHCRQESGEQLALQERHLYVDKILESSRLYSTRETYALKTRFQRVAGSMYRSIVELYTRGPALLYLCREPSTEVIYWMAYLQTRLQCIAGQSAWLVTMHG